MRKVNGYHGAKEQLCEVTDSSYILTLVVVEEYILGTEDLAQQL